MGWPDGNRHGHLSNRTVFPIPPMLHTLVILLFLSTISLTARDTVVVRKVTSATEIVLEDGRTIALLGVGPAKSVAIEPEEGRIHLEEILAVGTITIEADSTLTGPALASMFYVYAGDRLVNGDMIADGFGTASNKPRCNRTGEFAGREKEARAAHNGAWGTERSVSVQCSATTQKGTRCKRMTRNLSGKCWQHE